MQKQVYIIIFTIIRGVHRVGYLSELERDREGGGRSKDWSRPLVGILTERAYSLFIISLEREREREKRSEYKGERGFHTRDEAPFFFLKSYP